MQTTSYWLDTQPMPRFPVLKRNLNVDVVVAGAGIFGVTAAYLMKQAGLRVALLERARCGGVNTSYTTAHLTYVTDLRLHELVRAFGRHTARHVWDAGGAGIDQIFKNVQTEVISCDFKWMPGYFFAAINGKEPDTASLQEDATLAREFGFIASFTAAIPYLASPGVKFDHQALFHPLKYIRALLERIPGDGSFVFEHSEVTDVTEKPLTVQSNGYNLPCKYVVLATHTPLMSLAGSLTATLLQTKLSLYNSYALGAKAPAGSLPEGLFWDTAEPYNYLRIEQRRGFDYLILGGEDHKTGQEANTEEHYARLEARLKKWIPKAEVDHRWSGQVIETADGLPYIGETAESQFIATGFAGNGMTFGTLGGMMAVDAVLGRKNPWAELFSPRRKKLRHAAWDYVKENKDYPYYLIRNRLAGSEGKSLKALKRGQGKILNLNGHKVAAYRDDNGLVTLCSPVCTHLKCIVAWNPSEQTWDCPCHGSRFLPNGEVLSGPAETPLERIEEKTVA